MDREHAQHLIRRHEGVKTHVYVDTTGNRTIGIGCNLERADSRARIETLGVDFDKLLAGQIGLTDAQIDELFEQDFVMAHAYSRKHVANFDEHPDGIQSVILDMNFNLGGKFAKFAETIDGFVTFDYDKAAREMQESRWFS